MSVFAYTLEGSAQVEYIPKILFGGWNVSAKLDTTNTPYRFKPSTFDTWYLAKKNGKIILENPFNGVSSEISVNAAQGNLVVFTRKSTYNSNKVLTDTVNLRLDKDKFSGIDNIKIETLSAVDGKVIKTEEATYRINGTKYTGESII